MLGVDLLLWVVVARYGVAGEDGETNLWLNIFFSINLQLSFGTLKNWDGV